MRREDLVPRITPPKYTVFAPTDNIGKRRKYVFNEYELRCLLSRICKGEVNNRYIVIEDEDGQSGTIREDGTIRMSNTGTTLKGWGMCANFTLDLLRERREKEKNLLSLNEILDKLKPEFLHRLNSQCATYCTIGGGTGEYSYLNSAESPKWIQYRAGDIYRPACSDENTLFFRSSQVSHIYFYVSLDVLTDEEKEIVKQGGFNETYAYFKSLKYKFIAENYPTITEGGTQ